MKNDDLERWERKLTEDAIKYTNLMQTPEQKAELAKEIITKFQDPRIKLQYENSQEVKNKWLEVQKRFINLEYKLKNYDKALAEIKSKNEQNELYVELNKLEIEGLKMNEKECSRKLAKYSRERKSDKKLVWFLTIALGLQTTYFGVELSGQKGTYINKAYVAVKNWFK